MDTFLKDLRYGARMLWKSPVFTLVAVLVLALGIGANTAIFTVIEAVLLRPLPYHHSDRLVVMNEESRQLRGMSVAYLNFLDWESQNQVFESMGAFQPRSFILLGGDKPETLAARSVSLHFFSTFATKPLFGRDFLPEEDQSSGNPAAIISYSFWQSHLGGDRDVVGRGINLSGRNYTIVGILPKEFFYDSDRDLYVPLGLDAKDLQQRGNHPGIYVVARMKPGITLDQARADLSTIARRLEEQYPTSNRGNGVHMVSLHEDVVGDIGPSLIMLFAAVGCVLLIACANVANLLLARAASREKEIALRTALGAARSRVIQQLLTESILLALLGGLLGVALAWWGVDLLVAGAPSGLPRIKEIHVSTSVLLFALFVSVATGVVFGLMPALHALRLKLSDSLKDRSQASAGLGGQKLRSGLVISEVALSLVLLIGAGLLIRSFANLRGVNPGFNPQQLWTARVSLPQQKYPEREQAAVFFERLLQRLQTVPGVKSAALIRPLPLVGEGWQNDYQVGGKPMPAVGEFPNTDVHYVSTTYLRTMEIPLSRGRDFTDADRAGNLPVAIVNETFAKRWWPEEDPLGKQVRLCGVCEARPGQPVQPWLTVVGVASDVKQYGLDAVTKTEVYQPFLQRPLGSIHLVVRSATKDPLALTTAIRQAVMEFDKDQPINQIRTMDDIVADSMASRTLSMFLLSAFAMLALLLAAVGIYGVMSYSVTQRTREIGLRMALGADRKEVLKMVMSQVSRLTGIGLGAGLILALVLSRLMSGLLFGVHAGDPITFLGIAVLLAAVALLATAIPARRATKVDPMIALRYE